jgi:hypothetical protein
VTGWVLPNDARVGVALCYLVPATAGIVLPGNLGFVMLAGFIMTVIWTAIFFRFPEVRRSLRIRPLRRGTALSVIHLASSGLGVFSGYVWKRDEILAVIAMALVIVPSFVLLHLLERWEAEDRMSSNGTG